MGDHPENDASRGSSRRPVDSDTWWVTRRRPEERSMRIDRIRREIEEGSYDVPGEAVAEAMLAFYRRMPDAPPPGGATPSN